MMLSSAHTGFSVATHGKSSMAPQEVRTDFSDLTDKQVDSWIEKYIAKDLSAEPQCQLLLEERARRQSKVLKIEKSLQHLAETARNRRFTTYGDLAEASGVPWRQARHLMNGPRGHLDRLVEICHVRGIPLLTALCVNQQGANTGDLSEEALGGFINAANRLGYKVTDAKAFLKQCQRECFEWGLTALAPETQ
jgi:hypothetical protein